MAFLGDQLRTFNKHHLISLLAAVLTTAILQLPFKALLGHVAAKFAAFNLLPLPATNGGQALTFIGRRFGLDRIWPARLTHILVLAYLALGLSWVGAMVYVLNPSQ